MPHLPPRGRPIDLEALIARLGAEHSHLADALRLRCGDCGGRDVGSSVLAPESWIVDRAQLRHPVLIR